MPIYTTEVLDADEHTACGHLWIDLLSLSKHFMGNFDQGRQDNAPAFILRTQKRVVQRVYKPVLLSFSVQRSVCFLAKLPTRESEKR